MGSINNLKYLSLILLFGAGACTNNQYASQGGYDDLYGGGPNSGVVTKNNRDRRASEELSRSNNPDYQEYTDEQANGSADYYDDSYLSARGVQRNLSGSAGYNAGFTDGFNQATRFSNPYYGYTPYSGFSPYFSGSGLSLGLGFGFGSMFRMRPYMSLGYGYGGYSPYSSMYGYSPYGYDPFGYGYGSGLYGGYDSYYGFGGYGGYGGYGYNPWAYNSPVIIVNNNTDRRGYARTYGNRVSNANTRTSERYNSSFVNSPRSSNSTRERSARTSGSDTYYTSPRSSSGGRGYSSNGRVGADAGSGNVNTRSYSRGGNTTDGNTYYSRPRSSAGSNYSSDNVNTYTPSRSTRTYSSDSYQAPSRSQSNYSAPSRSTQTYQAPTRSYDNNNNYSAPQRSNNTYSAPSRSYSAPSYSAPSSGGGGGGGRSSSSRGPR